jgi:hypothetical protein
MPVSKSTDEQYSKDRNADASCLARRPPSRLQAHTEHDSEAASEATQTKADWKCLIISTFPA